MEHAGEPQLAQLGQGDVHAVRRGTRNEALAGPPGLLQRLHGQHGAGRGAVRLDEMPSSSNVAVTKQSVAA